MSLVKGLARWSCASPLIDHPLSGRLKPAKIKSSSRLETRPLLTTFFYILPLRGEHGECHRYGNRQIMSIHNYMTTREAALLLKISVPTAQQWVERGLLKAWKTHGGHRRIDRNSVVAMLEQQLQQAAFAQAQNSLSILIVEDEPSLIRLYRTVMEHWTFGVTIYTAPNGYEALILAGEVAPKMLVCDLRLPGINGFNIVRGLCDIERFKEMVIVVASGLSEAEIRAHGGLPDRVKIMQKPVDFKILESIAKSLLEPEACVSVQN